MKNMAVLVVLVGSCLPANAEVSDDLKFCGGLKSGAERLACYDAAARIASRPAPTRPATRTVPLDANAAAIVTKAPVLAPEPARNPFDGYYAAIGGAYGVGSGRDAGISGVFNTGGVALASTAGPDVSGVLGRNIAFSWGIVGLELDARWEGERGAGATMPTFPAGNNVLLSYRYKNEAGAHGAIRIGATFDDLLIFAKAGLGASMIRESFTADERNFRPCIVQGFPGCVTFGPPGSVSTVSATSWLPSTIFGVGAEKNWGSVFGRLSADFEAINHPISTAAATGVTGSSSSSSGITWTARGTAMIGVRF